MVVELAAKLRLTALLLGTNGAADLCSRFRAVNENTECSPHRVRDWLRDRAQPRSARLLADWAEVLALDRPGAWVRDCGFAEFAAELGLIHGERVAALAEQILQGRMAPSQSCYHAHLCGAYACYSQAWSPEHRGQIIRGALRLLERAGGGLKAAYSETLLGDAMQVEGPVEVTSGTVHMLLREAGSGLPVFMALVLPPEPVNFLAGIMAGPCFVVDHSLPTGTRIVAVRVPDGPALEASNRYLPPDAADITGDLNALGLPIARRAGVDSLVAALLRHGADQVHDREVAALRQALERSRVPPSG